MKAYGLLTIIIFTGLNFISPNIGIAESNEPNTTTKTLEERLAELEQKQKILERQLEIEREASAEKAKTTPIITANSKDGFSIKSPSNDFVLRFRGLIQADSRFVSGKKDSTATTNDDTFLLRRLRPIFEGTVWKDIDFKFVPDFGGGTTALQDAYLDFKYFPKAKLQVGRFKVPFGIERLQSSADTLFTELALSSNLTPNYDVGAALHSESLFNNKLSYAIGIFNGAADNASSDSDVDGNKEYAGRIFAQPWKDSGNSLIEGLGVGFATTLGDKTGTTSSTYKTVGQQTFFKYNSGVVADGQHTRYSPQLYYHYGSFGLLGEYVLSEQNVKRGTNSQSLKNKAWQVAASYVLTGESASYKGVKPKNPFDPKTGKLGAFELVGRMSQLNIDDNAFAGSTASAIASSSTSANAATAWGMGINWYLNNNVKASLDYEQTAFSGGSSSGDRQKERAILARVQLSF